MPETGQSSYLYKSGRFQAPVHVQKVLGCPILLRQILDSLVKPPIGIKFDHMFQDGDSWYYTGRYSSDIAQMTPDYDSIPVSPDDLQQLYKTTMLTPNYRGGFREEGTYTQNLLHFALEPLVQRPSSFTYGHLRQAVWSAESFLESVKKIPLKERYSMTTLTPTLVCKFFASTWFPSEYELPIRSLLTNYNSRIGRMPENFMYRMAATGKVRSASVDLLTAAHMQTQVNIYLPSHCNIPGVTDTDIPGVPDTVCRRYHWLKDLQHLRLEEADCSGLQGAVYNVIDVGEVDKSRSSGHGLLLQALNIFRTLGPRRPQGANMQPQNESDGETSDSDEEEFVPGNLTELTIDECLGRRHIKVLAASYGFLRKLEFHVRATVSLAPLKVLTGLTDLKVIAECVRNEESVLFAPLGEHLNNLKILEFGLHFGEEEYQWGATSNTQPSFGSFEGMTSLERVVVDSYAGYTPGWHVPACRQFLDAVLTLPDTNMTEVNLPMRYHAPFYGQYKIQPPPDFHEQRVEDVRLLLRVLRRFPCGLRVDARNEMTYTFSTRRERVRSDDICGWTRVATNVAQLFGDAYVKHVGDVDRPAPGVYDEEDPAGSPECNRDRTLKRKRD